MGVMECNRIGCDTILCDRLSNEFGYICSECFDEMVKMNIDPKIFMKIRKGYTFPNSYDYQYEKEFTSKEKAEWIVHHVKLRWETLVVY